MAHPFMKFFESAIRRSTDLENAVLSESEKLIKKGYRRGEVCDVLLKLEKSLIDEREVAFVHEAREEICEIETDTEDS